MKSIVLIGSTGSIGRQALSVVRAHADEFKIIAMAANSSKELFLRQIAEVKPERAVLISGEPCAEYSVGGQAAKELCAMPEADIVFVACSGFAGLKYTLAGIAAGKRIALANKETLVCGGDLVMPLVKKGALIPVDSEHSAIWQCLNFDASSPYKNIIITASGGAFRGRKWESLKDVTPEQALTHPTWNMGKKITIDSATLLNKGYEVIEAHHLYAAEYAAIKTVIQPQSIVHSMVEFEDGAIMAQLSNPTMELPIQLALTYPERLSCNVKPMDFNTVFSINFEPLERGNYPCYDLALTCGERGGTCPAVLNAAAEVAVGAFLQGGIAFTDIYNVALETLSKIPREKVVSYEQLEAVDGAARRAAQAVINKLPRR